MRLDLVVRLGAVRRERQPRRRGPPRATARSARWTSPRGIATATRSRSSPDGPGLTEVEVARTGDGDGRASAPTATTSNRRPSARRRDPGYYLISDGQPELERALARPSAVGRVDCGAPIVRSAATPATSATLALVTALRPRRAAACSSATEASPVRHARRRRPRPRPGVRSRRSRSSTGCVTKTLGPATAAPARARRRRADGDAHARRRADAAHRRGGRRGPGRRPRGPLPREPRGRPPLRPAVGLARRADRGGRPATTSSSPPRRRRSSG